MKSKLILCLLIAASVSSGFALMTFEERQALISKFSENPEVAAEAINSAQQADGAAIADAYVVIIKKEGEKYLRKAHFKRDKVGTPVEETLVNDVIKKAEDATSSNNGPVLFSFSEGKYAALSKDGDYLIFNIDTEENIKKALPAAPKEAAKTDAAVAVPTPEANKTTSEPQSDAKPTEASAKEQVTVTVTTDTKVLSEAPPVQTNQVEVANVTSTTQINK